MNLLVLLKMVPDVVEELEIASDGAGLDMDVVRMALFKSLWLQIFSSGA